VPARRAPSESPASSFRNLADERLGQVFLKVRAFVGKRAVKLGKVRPLVSCSDIFLLRRTNRNYLGDRALPRTIRKHNI
jgi:hypothetical protein